VVIRRQLVGHANLGITSVYLPGIDSSEIISTVHGRPRPAGRGDVYAAQREKSGATGSPTGIGKCFVARLALRPGELLLRGVNS